MKKISKIFRLLYPNTVQDRDEQGLFPRVVGIVLILVLIIGVTTAVVLSARPAYRKVKWFRAEKKVAQVSSLWEAGEYQKASELAYEAYQLAPTNPSVIREQADLATLTKDERSIYLWEHFADNGGDAVVSRGGLVEAYLTQDNLEEATRIAELLKVENPDSVENARAAFQIAYHQQKLPDSLLNLRKLRELGELKDKEKLILSMIELKDEDRDVRLAANTVAWGMAEGDNDELRSLAIDLLLRNPPSAPLNRKRLYELVSADETVAEESKVSAFGLYVESFPEHEDALIDEAVREREGMQPVEMYPFLQWLSSRNRPNLMLDLLSPFTSRELGTSIQWKCNALAALDRWEEVAELIDSYEGGLLPYQRSLYKAHLGLVVGDADRDTTSDLLRRGMRESKESGLYQELIHMANYGLAQGFTKEAMEGYEVASADLRVREMALKGLVEAARRLDDYETVIDGLRRLAKFRPGSSADQELHYYQAVVGYNIEQVAERSGKKLEAFPDDAGWALVGAIVKYRMEDSKGSLLRLGDDFERLSENQQLVASYLAEGGDALGMLPSLMSCEESLLASLGRGAE